MYVWNVRFVYETNRDNVKSINTVAESFTDAFVKAQNALPGAEIMALNKVGKLTDLNGSSWVDVISRYLIKHGTVSDIQQIADLCNEQMREELTDKIWSYHHNRRTN